MSKGYQTVSGSRSDRGKWQFKKAAKIISNKFIQRQSFDYDIRDHIIQKHILCSSRIQVGTTVQYSVQKE